MLNGVYCVNVSTVNVQHVPDFDIVFVHGLTSSADAAWKIDNGDIWPLWLTPIFVDSRVLLLNYPAPSLFCHPCSRLTIEERARNLADYLPTVGIGTRPTIFVCHSLGGILVKEIIRCCVNTGCALNVATNTIGVIFLATPHSGSNLANWAALIGSRLTADLATDSDYIVSLRDWFTQYAERTDIFVSAYYETQLYRNVIIVGHQSADPCCSKCNVVALDANHSSIAKPNSPNCDIFIRIKRDITVAKKRADDMATRLSTLDDILSLPDLTNAMYFEVINFINKQIYLMSQNAIIISNPCGGPRPCCIIIAKDQAFIQAIMPLERRFPDRFKVHIGILGEFTAGSAEPPMKPDTDIVSKLKEWLFNLKMCVAIKQGTNIFMVTAAHCLDEI